MAFTALTLANIKVTITQSVDQNIRMDSNSMKFNVRHGL